MTKSPSGAAAVALTVAASVVALVIAAGCSVAGTPTAASTIIPTATTTVVVTTTGTTTVVVTTMSTTPPTSDSSPSTSTSPATTSTSGGGTVDLTAGVTGSITWSTGSLPPPYNYSWTVTFTADRGTITLKPGYSSSQPSWSQDFPVTVDSMKALVAALSAAGVGTENWDVSDPLVGGATGSYDLTTASGQHLAVPRGAWLGATRETSSELDEIASAVESFAGAAWGSVNDSFKAWQSQQTH